MQSLGEISDDFSNNITTISTLNLNDNISGEIEVSGDTDWHKINVESGTNYQIDLIGVDGSGGTLSDPNISGVYDASGNLVNGLSNDDFGSSFDSRITFTATETGIYFIEAAAYDQTFGSYSISFSTVEPVVDDFASDIGTASSITVGLSVNAGEIEVAGDTDWHSVNLEAGRTYQIDLKGIDGNGGTLYDPLISGVYNASGTLIPGLSNDDFGISYDSQLVFVAEETSTYFIEAAAYDTDVGTYTITVQSTTEIVDDFSANIDTSSTIPINSSVSGAIDTVGDKDWHIFTVQAGTSYQIDLKGVDGNGGTLSDPIISAIYDELGNVQPGYFNDDFEGSYDSQLTFLADSSASYFIETSAFETDTGSYTLSVQNIGEIVDDYSNDVGTVSSISIGNSLLGEIEINGDIDWHRVEVEAGSTYTIDLEGAQNGQGTLADPVILGIYDESGSSLEQSNDDGGEGANSRLEFTPDENGSYYISATHYTDTEPGTYTISIAMADTAKADDFSADINTTGKVDIGSSSSGNLEEAGDHDWYAIELEANASYYFDVEGITLEDTYLYLRESSGELLKSDDDGGEGMNSRIQFRSPKTGRYYLDVGSYNDELTGTYNISAEKIENTTTDPAAGFNSTDGYGQIDASKAFEQLLGVDLPASDTLGGNLWGLDSINAPDVWNSSSEFSGTKGSGSIVAVIDTGVDSTHPEFQDRITSGYDFVDNDSNPDDEEGHGTHVAGTIAGRHDDGVGFTCFYFKIWTFQVSYFSYYHRLCSSLGGALRF